MLTGAGADTFAASVGLEQVAPSFFFTERRWQADRGRGGSGPARQPRRRNINRGNPGEAMGTRRRLSDHRRGIQESLTALKGSGGVIAIQLDGQIAWSFNTSGMYRARMSEGGTPQVAIFKDEP